MMNIKVPGIAGYDEDQIAIVMDDPGMTEWSVILGTPTIYRVMEVIKESEIFKLAVPWASSQVSWLMRDIVAKLGQVMVNDIANKPIAPLHVDEVVRVASKCTVHLLATRPFMVRSRPVAHMVTANKVPKVTNLFSTEQKKEQPTLSETERQDLLLEKLDLSSLEEWPQEQAEQAGSLLKEYHDIFLLEKHDMGHTNALSTKLSSRIQTLCRLRSIFTGSHLLSWMR